MGAFFFKDKGILARPGRSHRLPEQRTAPPALPFARTDAAQRGGVARGCGRCLGATGGAQCLANPTPHREAGSVYMVLFFYLLLRMPKPKRSEGEGEEFRRLEKKSVSIYTYLPSAVSQYPCGSQKNKQTKIASIGRLSKQKSHENLSQQPK